MAAAEFTVRQLGRHRWAVLADGEELQVHADFSAADAHAARLRADAAKQKRKCLRCNTPFLSWGAGNRLCGQCRRRDDFNGAV